MSQKYEYFGKYILLEKFATGGMAEVWLARAPGAGGIGKFVAIKKILAQYSDNPEFLQMFKDEATIAMNLSHGNIVSIYELGQEKNQLFLVMDFVEGRNLRQILNKMKGSSHKFSLDQIVYMIKEVAAGLDHAHRSLNSATGKPLNIIHRDMSPQNIMISFEGEVKIIDFGIAKAESQIEKTRSGTLKGKFGYMSPEQAEGQPTDLRTDVFSLGIVLWELLANDRLFIANNEINTLRKIRECNVPSLAKLNPTVSPELERIVMKALTRDRNLRYQTAAAMHRDLNRFLNRQYPDFSPHDFSVFIKTLYTDEIIELRSRQVEYAKIPFRPAVVKGEGEKTMVTSFPQMPTMKTSKNSIRAGTGVSIQSIQTMKAEGEPSVTETETFSESDIPEGTVTKPPVAESTGEKKQIELPTAENGAPLLNASLLSQNLQQRIVVTGKMPMNLSNDSPLVTPNATLESDTPAPFRPDKPRRQHKRHKRSSSNPALNVMIFLAAMIVTYVVVANYFPMQTNHVETVVRNLFGVAQNSPTPASLPNNSIRINTSALDTAVGLASVSPEKPTILPTPPTAGLTVNSVPSGAEIYVNGTDTGQTTPGVVNVPTNQRFSIRLSLDRYLDYNKYNLNFKMTGPTFTATLQPALIGYIDVDVRPPIYTHIYINGRRLSDSDLPLSDYAIPANSPVTIRAINPITGSWAERTVRLEQNQHLAIILRLHSGRRPASR